MAVDRKDRGEKIGGVNEARKEDKTEELLRGPLLMPFETLVQRLYAYIALSTLLFSANLA